MNARTRDAYIAASIIGIDTRVGIPGHIPVASRGRLGCRSLFLSALDLVKQVGAIAKKQLVGPPDAFNALLVSNRGEAVEVELADEGAPVVVLEILGEVLLGEDGLVENAEGFAVGRKCRDFGIGLGQLGQEQVGLCGIG